MVLPALTDAASILPFHPVTAMPPPATVRSASWAWANAGAARASTRTRESLFIERILQDPAPGGYRQALGHRLPVGHVHDIDQVGDHAGMIRQDAHAIADAEGGRAIGHLHRRVLLGQPFDRETVMRPQ